MCEQANSIQETGISTCDAAGRVGEIHVLGVLHGQPLTVSRLTGAITRYNPDVVAIEASEEAIAQYHPDIQDARWPPRDELEAAAYATDHLYDLLLAGIDTQEFESTTDFEKLDREIFSELGLINTEDDLSLGTYFELDLPTIRKWRSMSARRAPEAFETVIAERDEVMAGHLHALVKQDGNDTIVAAVGIQHLTGVLDLLSTPSNIPEDAVELPPLVHYRLFPQGSPHSKA